MEELSASECVEAVREFEKDEIDPAEFYKWYKLFIKVVKMIGVDHEKMYNELREKFDEEIDNLETIKRNVGNEKIEYVRSMARGMLCKENDIEMVDMYLQTIEREHKHTENKIEVECNMTIDVIDIWMERKKEKSVDEEQLLRYYRNELIASMQVKETPRDPRKKPLDLSRCKLKTLSNNSKIKTKTVKPIARVASKTIANNAPESNADPNSFVVEETNITNRKVEDDNVVANLLDAMLLPLIVEPHSPPAGVFADFNLADIVFPNEANEAKGKESEIYIPNNAKTVAVTNENERKKKRIPRGKGSSFAKLIQKLMIINDNE
eukprot:gene19452-21377_t